MKKIITLAIGLLLAGCASSNGVKSPEDGMIKSFAKCALKSDSTVIMLVPSRGFLADAIASATTSVSNNDGGFYNNLTDKIQEGVDAFVIYGESGMKTESLMTNIFTRLKEYNVNGMQFCISAGIEKSEKLGKLADELGIKLSFVTLP